MRPPPARSIVATIVAVLIAAPFLLMYARWRGVWLWPGLVFLAVAAVWRLVWFPRSGYAGLLCAGAGIIAGIGLGLLASIPAASALQGLKIRPGLIRMVLMFHGSWVGLLCGLLAGYYQYLRKVQEGAPRAPAPAVPGPGQTP